MATTPASKKAKGTRLEKEISKRLEDVLSHHDIFAKRTPMSGAIPDWKSDITTNLALAIECKNQERLNFRKAFRQAEYAATPQQMPLVLTSKNNDPQVIAIMDFEDLLTIIDWALTGGWLDA
jgi:hypothetical protein